MLAFIWAEAKNKTIGKNGGLPWNIPDDMKFFKETTINHQILAGSKTFASFKRPLPKRKNLILTHQDSNDFPENTTVFNNVDQFLHYANEFKNETIFVVGGQKVFKELYQHVDFLYITKIDKNIDGDVKMFDINYDDFKLLKSWNGEENQEYPHRFEIYQRK